MGRISIHQPRKVKGLMQMKGLSRAFAGTANKIKAPDGVRYCPEDSKRGTGATITRG